jgi:hypothetical protein
VPAREQADEDLVHDGALADDDAPDLALEALRQSGSIVE